MKRFLRWIGELFQSLLGWRDRPYGTEIVYEQLPHRLKQRTLYIVQEDDYFEQAALICPCGCGRVLQMNLLPDSRPCWQVTRHPDGTATLHPSVWRQKDCKSHFWFRSGRVQWCPNTPMAQHQLQ